MRPKIQPNNLQLIIEDNKKITSLIEFIIIHFDNLFSVIFFLI